MAGQTTLAKHPRIGFLISHAYLRSNPRMLELSRAITPYADVVVDSGAFTNMQSYHKQVKFDRAFRPITVEDYAVACREIYSKGYWGYFTLDVIGDAEQTWANYNQLKELGCDPIPILHARVTESHLMQYLEASQRVAVGGVAGMTSTNSIAFAMRFYSYIYNLSERKARIHALGFLQWPEVFQLPLCYADTTTYSNGSRFGEISYYDRMKGFHNIRFRNPKRYKDEKAFAVLGFLRRCGITMDMILDPELQRRADSIPSLVRVWSFIAFHRHAKERGLTYFFAVTGMQWMIVILTVLGCGIPGTDAFNYLKAREDYHTLIRLAQQDFAAFVATFCAALQSLTDHQSVTL